MHIETSITERFQLSIPVIQAPMAGGGDTAELTAAVSNAGGLGFVGAAYLTADQIIERCRSIREKTSKPFGINLFAPTEAGPWEEADMAAALDKVATYYKELSLPGPQRPSGAGIDLTDQIEACMSTDASVLSFTFGMLPEGALRKAKDRGIYVIGTATTVEEASLLAGSGVDAVVAQGSEAGGHRGTFHGRFESSMIGTMALVPQIADAIDLPVIASGGIMDGRGIAASLLLGADAVQMGTAFLTCAEAGIAEAYKAKILSSTEEQTRITRAFSGRPARGIANRLLQDYEQREDAILPFPLQNQLTRALRSEATRHNQADYLSLWAGQGLRMARRSSAAELMQLLHSETEAAFTKILER